MARIYVLCGIVFLSSLQGTPPVHNELSDFMQETIRNMILFNKYLFCSADTYKVLVSSAPFYGVMRGLADCPTQNYFYNKRTRQNIHQIAPVFKHMVNPLMGVSIATLLLLQFFTHDEHTRVTSNVLLAGLPFLWAAKDIIKAIPFPGNIRPKNACFNACKVYYGGFPSGHMFEITFMAYLFGAELGINYGLPLGALATLIAVQSVAINRHTISQLVAGTACGVAFGVAAQKVVRRDLHDNHRYGILLNSSGGLSLSYERSF